MSSCYITTQYHQNFGPDPYCLSRGGVKEYFSRANIAVWWDMMGCPWPKEIDLTSIRSNIELALKNMNYSGPATIFAYSKVNTIPHDVLVILRSQGIKVLEVEEGKDLAGIMSVDMIFSRFDNPESVNYLVITNEFILHNEEIVFCECNFLVASQKPHLGGIFRNRTSSAWQWSSLAAGGLPLLSKEIYYPESALGVIMGAGKKDTVPMAAPVKKEGARVIKKLRNH